jgi:hypothetical protein
MRDKARRSTLEGGRPVRIRRFAYSLSWLAALVLAAGAGWKTN